MLVAYKWPLTSTNRIAKSGPDTSVKVMVQFGTKLILYYLLVGYLLTKFQGKWPSVAKVESENLQAQKCWGGVAAMKSRGAHQLGCNPATPEATNQHQKTRNTRESKLAP